MAFSFTPITVMVPGSLTQHCEPNEFCYLCFQFLVSSWIFASSFWCLVCPSLISVSLEVSYVSMFIYLMSSHSCPCTQLVTQILFSYTSSCVHSAEYLSVYILAVSLCSLPHPSSCCAQSLSVWFGLYFLPCSSIFVFSFVFFAFFNSETKAVILSLICLLTPASGSALFPSP